MDKKKPCPFCGSYAEFTDDHAENCYFRLFTFQVMEWWGGIDVKEEYTSDDLVKAWNTRVYPGDETADYFILPKPKEKIANEYSSIKCDENGVPHAAFGYEIVQDAFNRWQDQIDAEIKQKLFEAFRPVATRDKRTAQEKCSRCGYPLGLNYCTNCGAKIIGGE